ncbi:hypothetical protein AMTR_s00144p00083740 [Amborella trichopoda]|uniref:Uncharacterized protein n=1 Tax=Amborella trichopoda TaxID=13333 RepID=W1P9N6_AMBTC|nr:hypothetical protein AMTR_s00144p00083740 [Amborella trichopoda]
MVPMVQTANPFSPLALSPGPPEPVAASPLLPDTHHLLSDASPPSSRGHHLPVANMPPSLMTAVAPPASISATLVLPLPPVHPSKAYDPDLSTSLATYPHPPPKVSSSLGTNGSLPMPIFTFTFWSFTHTQVFSQPAPNGLSSRATPPNSSTPVGGEPSAVLSSLQPPPEEELPLPLATLPFLTPLSPLLPSSAPPPPLLPPFDSEPLSPFASLAPAPTYLSPTSPPLINLDSPPGAVSDTPWLVRHYLLPLKKYHPTIWTSSLVLLSSPLPLFWLGFLLTTTVETLLLSLSQYRCPTLRSLSGLCGPFSGLWSGSPWFFDFFHPPPVAQILLPPSIIPSENPTDPSASLEVFGSAPAVNIFNRPTPEDGLSPIGVPALPGPSSIEAPLKWELLSVRAPPALQLLSIPCTLRRQ